MKNSIEIRQERAEAIENANTLLNLAKDESRDFTADEQVSYDGMMTKIDKLAKDIELVERQEKLNAEIASNVGSAPVQKTSDTKEARSYSMFKAIKGMVNNNLDGVEKEMHEEAVNEARSQGIAINGLGIPASMLEQRATVSQGSSAIAPTNILSYADALREASVFDKVGATMLTGLSANTTIPVAAKTSVAWEGENAATADGGANFSKVELSPVRCAAYVDISKQLLLQNDGVEQVIMRDLGRAVANKLDAAIFGSSNVTGAPTAIATSGSIGTFTESAFVAGSSVASDMVTAQGKLAEAGALSGNLAYVCSPELMGQIKSGAQVDSILAAMQGNLAVGYPVYFTNGVGSSAGVSGDFLFGDFSRLFIGMFGGLDITVDPYTQAASGINRLVLNNYVDFGVADAGAGFVKATSLVA
jgi:HK97 family phage major capsid protein